MILQTSTSSMTEVCRAPGMSFNDSATATAAVDDDGRTEEEDSFVSDGDSSRSPRCEAYVMTGEKMLMLNPKISPSYAKVRLSFRSSFAVST